MASNQCRDNCKFKLEGHMDSHTEDNLAAGASWKDKEFLKWVWSSWTTQSEDQHNVLITIINSYVNIKPTITARPKGTGVRFWDTITIATQIEDSHNISKAVLGKIQTHKQTAGKVCSIFLQLMWHSTKKQKKKKTITFTRKKILSSLPGIGTQHTTTVIDPVSKTVYGKIKIGITNNINNKLWQGDCSNDL